MKIYIKHMVSLRCKIMVKEELKKLNLAFASIELGEVDLLKNISEKDRKQLKTRLHDSGLVLMDDINSILVERIINIIVEMVHHTDELPKVNFSNFLVEKLQQDYYTLSDVFSKTKGITIEQFIILHKIERVKELIIYDELNLTEIADKMHYSSVAHLSNQFKKNNRINTIIL